MSTTAVRTVPAAFTVLLHDYLESRNQDAEAVLGTPRPSDDSAQSERVDVVAWEKQLILAGEALSERHLGIELGAMINASHLGLVGHLLLACENFNDVLDRLVRYQRLIFDAIPMTRHDGPELVEMVWDISEFRTGPLVGEVGFAAMVQFCRIVVIGGGNPHSIDFAHPAPDDPRPFEEFFNCPVRFGCDAPVIRADRELLDRPIQRTDPALLHVLEPHVEKLLASLPDQNEVVVQLRKTLVGRLRHGEPRIAEACRELGCSVRTLQRQLTAAGTSFRNEVNIVRNELAKSYLADSRLAITEVAMLLGYSEHSAFTRAFRKINGCTPHQQRSKNKQGTA
jgi:AraC-like DNA-binding protein